MAHGYFDGQSKYKEQEWKRHLAFLKKQKMKQDRRQAAADRTEPLEATTGLSNTSTENKTGKATAEESSLKQI